MRCGCNGWLRPMAGGNGMPIGTLDVTCLVDRVRVGWFNTAVRVLCRDEL